MPKKSGQIFTWNADLLHRIARSVALALPVPFHGVPQVGEVLAERDGAARHGKHGVAGACRSMQESPTAIYGRRWAGATYLFSDPGHSSDPDMPGQALVCTRAAGTAAACKGDLDILGCTWIA